jgi:hypothetical protein
MQRCIVALVAPLVLSSCSHGTPAAEPAAVAEPSAMLRPVPIAAPRTTEAEPGEVEPSAVAQRMEETPEGSFVLRAPSVVRVAPAHDAVALGVLAVGTRLPRQEPVEAPGCRGGWVSVQPRGFACIAMEVSPEQPQALQQPVVASGGRLPTVYGRVRRAAKIYADAAAVHRSEGQLSEVSLTVERRGSVRVDGEVYWRTRHGLIARNDIRRLRGSSFEGVALDASLHLPVAWTIPGERRTTPVRLSPSKRSRASSRVPAFTVLHEPDAAADPDFVFAPTQGWLPRADVRVAMPAEPPADLQPDEMWLDVDLAEQTLVAYRGAEPVFATLVSTGKARYETPTGEFRIERKVAMRTMNSRPGAKESYAVDKVPWTAYFKDGYALHTAYWHSGFGRVRSHGCINLSPTDAKRLYDWMGPHAAPGWREVYATADQPGTRLRVREG